MCFKVCRMIAWSPWLRLRMLRCAGRDAAAKSSRNGPGSMHKRGSGLLGRMITLTVIRGCGLGLGRAVIHMRKKDKRDSDDDYERAVTHTAAKRKAANKRNERLVVAPCVTGVVRSMMARTCTRGSHTAMHAGPRRRCLCPKQRACRARATSMGGRHMPTAHGSCSCSAHGCMHAAMCDRPWAD
jgi:hypothetical protein